MLPCLQDVKSRSRQLTALVDTFRDAYAGEVGSIQRVCVVERAAKAGKLVGHNERYTQARPALAVVMPVCWVCSPAGWPTCPPHPSFLPAFLYLCLSYLFLVHLRSDVSRRLGAFV